MPSLVSAGAGLMLATLAHTVGWPIPVGGSQAIPDALIADLRAHGGTVIAGEEITAPPPGVVLYDTAPTALLAIYGDKLPARYAKALQRYRFGPGVAKVDFVLSGEIPWTDPRLGRRADPAHGRNPRTDGPRRTRGRRGPPRRNGRWCLQRCHTWPTPAASTRRGGVRCGPTPTCRRVRPVDQTETVTEIFERFAPGFRDIVVAARSVPAARLTDHNANLVGGDIGVGGNTLYRAIAGPTPRLNPWSTPIPKAYLCSSATPPGGGVHGMSGYYAARTVLRREFGITRVPRLSP